MTDEIYGWLCGLIDGVIKHARVVQGVVALHDAHAGDELKSIFYACNLARKRLEKLKKELE